MAGSPRQNKDPLHKHQHEGSAEKFLQSDLRLNDRQATDSQKSVVETVYGLPICGANRNVGSWPQNYRSPVTQLLVRVEKELSDPVNNNPSS